jgi:hypothetical protein
MLEYREKTVQEVAVCVCDRCQLRIVPEDADWQERISISYSGGFDSIFGDGNLISIDLCQRCVRETLGPWLRIVPLHDADSGLVSDHP